MKHAWILLGVTVAVITGWGIGFDVTQDSGIITGLYWSVTTAFTVGYGDVTAHGDGGHLLSIGTMVTEIPLMAVTGGAHLLGRFKLHLRHERRQAGQRGG